METDRTRPQDCFSLIFAFAQLLVFSSQLTAAERIHTAYFSPAPGASSIIWVAKEARLFDKHGLDVAPVLIPSSVRALQAILAGESPIAESAGPAVVSARLAGGDVVAIVGSVNILTYYFVTVPGIKRPEDLKGKIGANQSPGTIADFALRVSLRKLGLDSAKDVSLRSIGVLYDRIAAMQKGIVQFTVVTEAEKPIVDKLGYPILLDLISLRIPFPQRGIYTTGKTIKEQPETVRRYARAYVEAIHYFKTRKEETMQIMRKYSRVEDRNVLEHAWSWFTQNMPEYPYPPVEGYQGVLQEMASTQPKAAALNVKELVDARFVKELEDAGFIANLHKNSVHESRFALEHERSERRGKPRGRRRKRAGAVRPGRLELASLGLARAALKPETHRLRPEGCG